MTELTKAELRTKINNLIPSNNPGSVSAANFRELLTDMIDSLLGSKGETSSIFTPIGSGDFTTVSDNTFPSQLNASIINIPDDVQWFGIMFSSTVDDNSSVGTSPLFTINGDKLRSTDNQVNYDSALKTRTTATENTIAFDYPVTGKTGDTDLQVAWVQAGSNKRLIIGLLSSDTITATLYRVS